MVKRTVEERFWEKVNRDGPIPEHRPELGRCWVWTGGISAGYGAFWWKQRLGKAHIYAYDLYVGPVPDGLCVLHHCDTRPCVRPDHLFLGTKADNTADMIAKGRAVNPQATANRAKTHCPQGHPYDLLNTYWDARDKRSCRACHNERDRHRRKNR